MADDPAMPERGCLPRLPKHGTGLSWAKKVSTGRVRWDRAGT